MLSRAQNPSRTRTVLAVLLLWPVLLVAWFWRSGRISLRTKALTTAGGLLMVAVVAGVSGAGSSSHRTAEDARSAATTVTTTWGPEYLAPAPGSSSSLSSAPPSTVAPPTSTTGGAPPATGPSLAAASAPVPAGDDTTVERIVDGDTIVVAGGTRVRLIGVDTPETQDPRTTVQCFGPEASRHTGELLPAGTPVRLVYDVERTDRYGRTLAYVYRLSDGLFVNVALVHDGFASVATYPPNVAHVDEFRAAEADARDAGRGLWGACPAGGSTPTTPTTVTLSPGGSGACDSSYPDLCIPHAPPDLDCGQITDRNFRVVGADPHRFDGNHDGVGCEG